MYCRRFVRSATHCDCSQCSSSCRHGRHRENILCLHTRMWAGIRPPVQRETQNSWELIEKPEPSCCPHYGDVRTELWAVPLHTTIPTPSPPPSTCTLAVSSGWLAQFNPDHGHTFAQSPGREWSRRGPDPDSRLLDGNGWRMVRPPCYSRSMARSLKSTSGVSIFTCRVTGIEENVPAGTVP